MLKIEKVRIKNGKTFFGWRDKINYMEAETGNSVCSYQQNWLDNLRLHGGKREVGPKTEW